MKILMLTDRLGLGGAETHIAELCRGLRRLGVEVETLSAGGAVADALEREGFVCHRMPLYTHSPLRLLLLRRRIRALVRLGGYDVLHAHARIPALLLRGLRRTRAARIVTVHARFRADRMIDRLCYWGERTVAVSEDLRAYVCDAYCLAGDAVSVIPNGVDCEAFSAVKRQREEGGLGILFVSRLDTDCAQGAKLLCEIAPALCRSYRDLTVTVAGGGGALKQVQALADAVNKMLGREAVNVCGAVENMADLLCRHEIFVGVSRSAMEAAAAGCAVILCGDEGYLGILNRENASHAALSNFCCRGECAADRARLERDLRFLINHEEERQRYAKEGREYVRKYCSAEGMCRSTLELYQRTQRFPTHYQLLAGGYFGCGNAGDDAMLMGFLREMHHLSPGIAIRALTAHPKRAKKRFGVHCVDRKNPIAILFALIRADAFLLGGGSILQNTTSRRSLRYYLFLLRIADLLGCRVIVYSAGIGPIQGERDRARVVHVLNRCDYISLRDPDSLRFLTELGVDASLLHLGGDPALLLAAPPLTRYPAILHAHRLNFLGERMCVVLRSVPDNILQSVIVAVRLLCQRRGMQAMLVCFCKEDEEAIRFVMGEPWAVRIRARGVEDLAAMIAGASAVLSMRLHALVLASLHATPAIGIVTDPTDSKIVSFTKGVGQDAILYPKPSVAELVAFAEFHLWGEGAQNSRLLTAAVEEMQKKARKDLANIVEMLYNEEDKGSQGK